jgi:hypothetical protein
MMSAELGEPLHGDPVLLVRPRELKPEFVLRNRGSGVTAGNEQAQRRVALVAQLFNAFLKSTELHQRAPRQDP